MQAYGIPQKIITMIRLLYEDAECAVLDEGKESLWFKVKTGVKQECVLSGFLFLPVIDWIMKKVTKDNKNGIRWRITSKLEDLDFADDIALVSTTCQQMQEKTTCLNEISQQFGLKINQKKTKVMKLYGKSSKQIEIERNPIEEVDTFTYLGATVNNSGGGEEDIKLRLNKARRTFRRMNQVWNSAKFSRTTKIRLYNTLVIPVPRCLYYYTEQKHGKWPKVTTPNSMFSKVNVWEGFKKYSGRKPYRMTTY